MVAFRDTLEVCELVDLGFTGLPFTYDNKRGRSANVKVRLDQAVATNGWRNLFAYAVVEHIPSPCSDHLVLFMKGEPDLEPVKGRSRRYEVFWERDSTLPQTVQDAWSVVGEIRNLSHLRDALSKTMTVLGTWSKRFGSVTRELAKSRTQLEELMLMNADREEIRVVMDKMNELLYREEMM
uniref:Endonuclease/exonuclease/phosphatase domain-containing protein n=2 Tax=Aegilops tauschii subsp. strangulata TaxID=200361 RepID=A0A453S201_AEGTS